MLPQDIRLAPAVAARLLGVAVVALGLLTLALVIVATLADLPAAVVVLTTASGLFLLGAIGLYLLNFAYVLRVTKEGYRVRFVRGAGITRARWSDVEDAVTTYVAQSPCVVLRLKDGGSTSIPVQMLSVDREHLVKILQEALLAGRGLKRMN